MITRFAGLLLLMLLASPACSTPESASPPAPAPAPVASAAEQLPPDVPPAPVPKIVTPVKPPATIEPAPSTPAPDFLRGPGPNEVWIWDNEYRPDELTVPLGTTVVWTSYDIFHQHDVDCPGVFFGSLVYGVSFNHTFVERGIFAYHDGLAGMLGRIIVK